MTKILKLDENNQYGFGRYDKTITDWLYKTKF